MECLTGCGERPKGGFRHKNTGGSCACEGEWVQNGEKMGF